MAKRNTNKKSKKDFQSRQKRVKQHPEDKAKANTSFKGQSIPKEEDSRPSVSDPRPNDPAWYGVSPQMVNDTARISFNNPAGLPLRVWQEGDFAPAADFNKKGVPGIMTFRYMYGPGVSKTRSSAINLAANNLYAFVRHVNSGAANYEVADLMMYFYGVASCYVLYMELVRLYGFTLQYRQSNRYFNQSIIRSLGFNPVEIERHLPQLRFAINKFARKIGTKPLPDNLNIFKRMTFLPQHVFTDANVRKAQLYSFIPSGYYTYEEVETAHGTYLKWHTREEIWNAAGVPQEMIGTVEGIERLTDYMANKILDSEDIGIMSGDIMKAYGNNVFMLSEIDETFRSEPFFSEEILDQIHNLTIMGTCDDMDIVQTYDTNLGSTLIWAPTLNAFPGAQETDDTKIAFGSMTLGNACIDLPYDDPTPEDVMVATRLTCRADEGANPIMMTELVESADIYTMFDGATAVNGPIYGINRFDGAPLLARNLLNMADMWTSFDRGPKTTIFMTGPNKCECTLYDYYNYTYIGVPEISKMHETAVLSLWDVPETAFYKSV